MQIKSPRGSISVAVGAALAVALWGAPASALTTAVSDVDGLSTTVSGSAGDDQITLRVEPPASPESPHVLSVEDPGGVDPLEACVVVSPTVARCNVRANADVFADAGNDTVDFSYAPGAQRIAALTLLGGDGNDDLRGSDLDDAEINGGRGDDRLDGRGGADFVDCGEGFDTVVPDVLDMVNPGCENFLDLIPPETTILSGPTGIITSRRPTFVFSSSEAGTFTCQVDGGQIAACVSPFTVATQPPGPHTFRVTATDAAGNADPTPATRTFTIVPSGSRGAGTGAGGPGAAGSSKPAVSGAATARTVRVSSKGSFVLGKHRVTCPAGGSRCRVTTTARRRTVRLGGFSYRLAAGKSGAVKVKLSRKGLRLLRRAKRVRATVTITIAQGAQTATKAVKVTLRAPRKK